MTKFTSRTGLSRRALLKGAASTAIAAGSTTLSAPMLWAQNIKDVTIRQFGTGVSNLNDVANKVKEDLGFTLEMTALDTDSVTQRAATQPVRRHINLDMRAALALEALVRLCD